MSDIEVRKLNRDEYKIWDELVESSTHGTIFHKSFWLSTCSELLNKKLKIYGCFQGERLVGGCSLFIHKSGFFKIASSTISMTPYGGVVLAHSPSSKVREQEQTYNKIIKSLCNALDNEHFDHIQLVNSPDFIDIRSFVWNGWDGEISYAYYLDLNNFSLSKDARWMVNKALKSGIIVEKSEDASLFYELFRETYLRQGLKPPVSGGFFKDMFNMLQNQNKGEIWIAKTKTGEIAASEISIYDNKRAYRWAAASHTNLRKTGATFLLLCKIFQNLKNGGFKQINLMAANTPHLAKFISQFNPMLVPYYGVEKTNTVFKLFRKSYYTYKHLRK